MSRRVYFRGSRDDARRIVVKLSLALTGRDHAAAGVARSVFIAIGMAALSDIKADFVRKARGGTGEDGVKWKPLKKETIAYSRRFGKGEKSSLKKAAGLGRGHRFAPGGRPGLMSATQLKQWKAIYASVLRRLMASADAGEAKSRAAKIAWAVMKKRGVKTMLQVFGNRSVETLRDTGVLLNSLSPGQMVGDGYQKPAGVGDDQVFDITARGVIVGTNVPYAPTHQNGDPERGVPARPFLPVGDPPEVWRQRWLDVGATAVAAGLTRLLRAA